LRVLRSSNAFLIAVHSLLLLVYAMHGVQNGLQMVFSIFYFLTLICISSAYHIILWLLTRKRSLAQAVRIPLHLLPVAVIMILSLILPKPPELPNQQSTLVSPSGRYAMDMDMKGNRWIVSISDRDGKLLYRDNDSNFVGHFNVYWVWDNRDRLWLYNSDDGHIYYWIRTSSAWQKAPWSDGTNPRRDEFSAPANLYPDYARQH